MTPEERTALRLLITESEERIHRHIHRVAQRANTAFFALFLCAIFPGAALLIALLALLFILLFSLLAAVSLPFHRAWNRFQLGRIQQANQDRPPRANTP
jgi:energy-coupling factor transporter transmembrane protein EcfT